MTIIRRSTEAYFLPYEGRVYGRVYQGGNIFRRFGRFVRRNVPNLLRNVVPFIPRVADWIVTEGARRGHIPDSHRKIYEESLRPYVRYVPSLLKNPIDSLDKKLNPTEQTTASTPSAPQQTVSQEGGRSVILKHDFSIGGNTSMTGGNITGTTKATKKRSTTSRARSKTTTKKTTSKSKAVTTKSKPKIGTAEYHKIIDQHIAQFGAGILQTSISHDMTHV